MATVKKARLSKFAAAQWAAIAEGNPDLLPGGAGPVARAAPVKREAPIQRAIVVTLRRLLPPGSIVFSVPNHARSDVHRFSLIAEGMTSGMPDLFVVSRGRWYGLECKAPRGVLSDAQKRVHAALEAHGCPCGVVRSAADALAFLQKRGAL
jgi:hypothetical protein